MLDAWNGRRAAIAARYSDALTATNLVLPAVPTWAEPVWHLYVVQSSQRDALQMTMADVGIGTLIHYPIPPHLQKAYVKSGYVKGQYKIAERIASQVLSLPIGPQMDDLSVDAVIATLNTVGK